MECVEVDIEFLQLMNHSSLILKSLQQERCNCEHQTVPVLLPANILSQGHYNPANYYMPIYGLCQSPLLLLPILLPDLIVGYCYKDAARASRKEDIRQLLKNDSALQYQFESYLQLFR